ncbi:hypothetical protein [Microbacterium sp. BLY]|uniref:hypothetical protein n=1 Tax=Microbacterium sp. BLY TaxID=2823280 RepID=UPI001B319101|nr:hypothetical protein [Microbacterium sp. BLY]MBP3976919.1 hypothetical protein [Microbacterium sp. BLY]
MTRKAAAAFTGLAVVLVCLVGCTGVADGGDPSASRGPDEIRAEIQGSAGVMADQGRKEQAEAFRDGVVDEDEYLQALRSLRSCIEEGGYGFSEPALSPVTGLNYEFVYYSNGRDEEKAGKDYAECEAQYWQPLQGYYFSTHAQRMDEQLKNAVLQCMDDKGHPGVADGTNLVEISPIIGDDEDARVAARECATKEAERLYPELPSVTVFD